MYSQSADSARTYIAIYVDDLLFIGPSIAEIKRVKDNLQAEFGIKDLGPAEWVLGIQIVQTPQGLWLGQTAYIDAVLSRFDMASCRPLSTPMEHNLQLFKTSNQPATPEFKRKYLQAIGSLMYAMLGTRPDLGYAVSYLARFAENPSTPHWTAIQHIFRYLAGTRSLGLFYLATTSPTNAFYAYSDSDWASCVNSSRSTMGYTFLLAGAAISWSSRLQTRVACSSTEAEYIALGHAGKEGVHLIQQLDELGVVRPTDMVMYGDNQGAIALTREPRFHDRSKHIRMAEHFAREMVQQRWFDVRYIPTGDMVADIMTKALPAPTFERLRGALGVLPIPAGARGGVEK